jgi:hypothetical protein
LHGDRLYRVCDNPYGNDEDNDEDNDEVLDNIFPFVLQLVILFPLFSHPSIIIDI